MDFTNFADLKKEASATADSIFEQGEKAKQSAEKTVHDFLGDNNSPAGVADNAHTGHLFSNEQKDLDFEHVDPQAFVQRMSAGAKEAQVQLDAKFGQFSNEFDAFGTKLKNDTKQGLADWTSDFMNVERGYGGAGDLSVRPTNAPPPPPAKNVVEGDLLGHIGNGDSDKFAPTAPLAPINPIPHYNEDDSDPLPATKSSSASNKDSDTEGESISASYNPSPVKKNPVTDALKEQDNDKFISSEDLLGDIKDERTSSTPPKGITDFSIPANKPATSTIQTTDLDDDFQLNTNTIGKEKSSVPSTPPVTPSTPAPFKNQTSSEPPLSIPKETLPKKETFTDLKPTPAPAASVPSSAPTVTQPSKVTPSSTATTANKVPVATTHGQQQPKILYVEEIFYKYGLDAWFKPERLHPLVESLIYWRDVKKSGIVFGAGLIVLLAVSCFSVISVFAYISLLTLIGTIAFRIYKTVMQAIQKTPEGHPFKDYLDLDLTLSQEKVQNIAGVAVAHVNAFTAELRRLFLVEDIVDSIKFGVILWVLTYVGAWFNGMTLVILAFVSLFTLPKVYENNKQSIDTYLDLVRSKLTEITDKIKVAIPIGNKKPIAETDKDK